jgi:polysaccharide export outer membrane protein
VNAPGVIPFTEESISLLDAIGLAKDLTYSAIRTDVKLIREVDGKRIIFHIDLTTASWMSNPDYRIRQNDVIMVTPNKLKVNSGGLIKDPIQLLGITASLLSLFLLFKLQ